MNKKQGYSKKRINSKPSNTVLDRLMLDGEKGSSDDILNLLIARDWETNDVSLPLSDFSKKFLSINFESIIQLSKESKDISKTLYSDQDNGFALSLDKRMWIPSSLVELSNAIKAHKPKKEHSMQLLCEERDGYFSLFFINHESENAKWEKCNVNGYERFAKEIQFDEHLSLATEIDLVELKSESAVYCTGGDIFNGYNNVYPIERAIPHCNDSSRLFLDLSFSWLDVFIPVRGNLLQRRMTLLGLANSLEKYFVKQPFSVHLAKKVFATGKRQIGMLSNTNEELELDLNLLSKFCESYINKITVILGLDNVKGYYSGWFSVEPFASCLKRFGFVESINEKELSFSTWERVLL